MLQLKQTACAQALMLMLLSGSSTFAAEVCASVMDYAGMPLPAASVSATNLTTGKSYAAKSDKNGVACLSGIPEGLYSVEASLTGFLHVKYYPVRAVPLAKQTLSFWLLFGEISEGGLGDDSTLSGTLLKGGVPVEAAKICITANTGVPKTCTVTNEIGEYALQGPPGVYATEIHTKDGKVYRSQIDMSTPGIYRNRLSLDSGTKERQN
jgi:Carboxypeptidase regulatory-like domain